MDIFFICLFVISAVASFLTPSGALGMVTLFAWIVSGVYIAFRYHKDITAFINDLF